MPFKILNLFFKENAEKKNSPKEEPSQDMSSIIEKLKSQRRASNSSSVSQTSTTGAIESTSGLGLNLESAENVPKAEVTEIPVNFGSDNQSESDQKSANQSNAQSAPEDDEKSVEKKSEQAQKPNLLETIFGGAKQAANEEAEELVPETSEDSQKPPSLLESIFTSASKKGKGVVSLADSVDSSMTHVTQLPVSTGNEPDSEDPIEAEHVSEDPADNMKQILENLKRQTEAKSGSRPSSLIEQRPEAPGGKVPKILIFGDELISDLQYALNEPFKYDIEIHMLEGAQTKNIQKYITESIGTRKDAECCIFHVGTNDLASKRSESQFNTALMLLFGASRASFPNAKLCYSSILPRHDEFQSKVSKFNVQADKQCENCAVEFLNNTKIFNDVDNYVYKKDPTECVQLTREGKLRVRNI